ncbi:MAG: glutaredoxin 3 [Rhodospirillales bacterium]|nr:glutaredoxin 3 [Rhodospirillales bacterium]
MTDVEVYSGYLCGYCFAAKRLLRRKGVAFQEFNISLRPGRRAEMMKRANGHHTVPQIFIDGKHIGGCDELMALDAAGKLDRLLGAGG